MRYLLKYKSNLEEEDAEIYRDWKGVETAYSQILEDLKSGDSNLVMGATMGEVPKRTKIFFEIYNRKRIEKEIFLKIIYNLSNKEFALSYLNNKQFDNLRFLESQSPAEINISNSKVLILLLTKKPIAILIKSTIVANSFREYFEFMWAMSKK